MKPIVVFGAGGFGREVAQLIEDLNRVSPRYELLGFLDDDPAMVGKVLNGYPVQSSGHCLESASEMAAAVAAMLLT